MYIFIYLLNTSTKHNLIQVMHHMRQYCCTHCLTAPNVITLPFNKTPTKHVFMGSIKSLSTTAHPNKWACPALITMHLGHTKTKYNSSGMLCCGIKKIKKNTVATKGLDCFKNSCKTIPMTPLAFAGSVWSICEIPYCRCELCPSIMIFSMECFYGNALLCALHHKPIEPVSQSTQHINCVICPTTADNNTREFTVLDDMSHKNKVLNAFIFVCAYQNNKQFITDTNTTWITLCASFKTLQ